MNRQSSSPKSHGWVDRGPVSFKEAAIAEAKWNTKPKLTVQVRDEAEPEIVHTLTVTREVNYRVEGLRGGE